MKRKPAKKPRQQSLSTVMTELAKQPHKYHPSVFLRPEFGLIEICLEDVGHYAEWIKDEGGDISIWRAHDDRRVVGATLPLREWTGFFGTWVEEKL